MTTLTTTQKFKADQITGWVNKTLKYMPNKPADQGVEEYEACLIIQAATFKEHDQTILDYVEAKFKKWYNYES